MTFLIIFILVLLAYAWVAYPLLLRLVPVRKRKEYASPGEWPEVVVLVAAYNEEGPIEPRLENLMRLSYPAERLTVRVGVDGSDDRTAEIAQGFALKHPNVRVHDFKMRRGKVAVLRDLVAATKQQSEVGSQKSEDSGQVSPKDESPHLNPLPQGERKSAFGTPSPLRGEGGGEGGGSRKNSRTAEYRTAEYRRQEGGEGDPDHGGASEMRRDSRRVSPRRAISWCLSSEVSGQSSGLSIERREFEIEHPVPEILVFTDANTAFRDDALEKLIGHFSDPSVGGVCGRLVFREAVTQEFTTESRRHGAESECCGNFPRALARGEFPQRLVDGGRRDSSDSSLPLRVSVVSLPSEGVYWRLETFLKERESALDSCLGANGAIYAIRSELFWRDLPENTVVDDFVIGMKVREMGFRMVYEPEAVAEEVFPHQRDEWKRRVRIGSGDYQALGFCRRCLLPAYGWFSWMFWSHKVLRWFTPHLLVGLAVLAAFLCWTAPTLPHIHTLVLVGLALFLLSAAMGAGLRNAQATWARPFRLCAYFLTMQVALLAGFVRFCRGNLKGHWVRTPRGGQ